MNHKIKNSRDKIRNKKNPAIILVITKLKFT